MPERLIERQTTHTVISSDYLPSSLSEHAGIERIDDTGGRPQYYALVRGPRLKAPDIESAFEQEGLSLEDAIKPSLELEQLREDFEEYKRDNEIRVAELESRLEEAAAEISRLEEVNKALVEQGNIPPTSEENNVVSENRFRRGWNRISGAIGSALVRKQVELHNGIYNRTHRSTGEVEVVQERVVDDYPESDRERGRNAVIAFVGAVALAVIAYQLGKRLNDDTVTRTVTETVPGPTRTTTVPEVIEGSPVVPGLDRGADPWPDIVGPVPDGTKIGDSYRHYFNGNSGNKGFAVHLPEGFDVKPNASSRYDIIDANNNTVVRNIEFDQQGNLSKSIRRILRRRFDLEQHRLAFFDRDGGPGRRGWVRHFVTAVKLRG